MNEVKPSKTLCKECQNSITWAAQKVQWKRLIYILHMPESWAKLILPRCQKCVSKVLREMDQMTRIEEPVS